MPMKMTKAKSVSHYIESFPNPTKKMLKQIRSIIKKNALGAEEKISYGMVGYKLHGVLLYFNGYEHHIGFYAMPSAVQRFKKELSKYETSKGTIRFPLDKPLPLKLISRIVKYRVKENLDEYKK